MSDNLSNYFNLNYLCHIQHHCPIPQPPKLLRSIANVTKCHSTIGWMLDNIVIMKCQENERSAMHWQQAFGDRCNYNGGINYKRDG